MSLLGGLELQPPIAYTHRGGIVLFQRRSPGAKLAGVMVGRREHERARWEPARLSVTIECVVVDGIRLHTGPLRNLVTDRDLGYPIIGSARTDALVSIYVRNDGRAAELRAVLLVHGKGEDARPMLRALRG